MNHSTTLRAMRVPSQLLRAPYFPGQLGRTPLPIASLLSGQVRHASSSKVDEKPPTSLSNTTLNPPATTRAPPLEVPTRGPDTSTFSYLFQTGKAYVKFYKSGLYAVFTNRRLLAESLAKKPAEDRPSVFRPGVVPGSFTRADWVLLWRVRHDLLRVPLFGVVLLICGEFTPLVVVFVDGVVPYTCQLPKQISSAHEKAEERRKISFRELEREYPQGVLSPKVSQSVVQSHVLRSLHLIGNIWDRVNFVPPWLWQLKGKLRMSFLEGDDRLLVKDGGVSGLHVDELKIACAERGINVLGRKDGELRELLGDWLRLTAAKESTEARRRMTVLLATRTDNWPKNRDFALPEWHL